MFHQADQQVTARDMVRRYDLASADPVSKILLHRVSHYLLGTDSGQLGRDFREWANDGHMSDRLRTEITAYQLCVLDDSFVESPHALVSRTARQSPVPSPSWWSSSVRFDQNFADYDSAARDAPGQFEHLFSKYKLIAQGSQSQYLSGRQRLCSEKQLLRWVYRTGAKETQFDWSVLRPLTERVVAPAEKFPDMEVMLKEYLLALFVPGTVVEAKDSRSVSPLELLSGAAQVSDEPALLASRNLFQVVSRSLVSKRFVSTETVAKMKAMRVPVVLQRLALQDDEGQELPASVVAFPEGVPEVRDVRFLGSVQDLRHGLHSWAVQAVQDDGGLVLVGRQSLGQRAWTPVAQTVGRGNSGISCSFVYLRGALATPEGRVKGQTPRTSQTWVRQRTHLDQRHRR